MDGVSVGGGSNGSGLPLGRASGVQGAGSPCKVWDLVGQTLLDYSPVVIAPYANSSGELAKA